MIAFEYHA